MKILEKKINFAVTNKIQLEESISEYFTQSGFNLKFQDNTKLIFIRGSYFTNFWTFNPLKWKSNIEVSITDLEVKVTAIVHTVGQIVLTAEDRLWDEFLNNLKVYLTENIDFKENNRNQLREVKKESIKFVGKIALGGLIDDYSDARRTIHTKEDKNAL